jgi:hypothetical protein
MSSRKKVREFLQHLPIDAPLASVHPYYYFFVSFRGEEGRSWALKLRCRIIETLSGVWRVMEEVFVDDLALREGETLEAELAEASRESMVFIILASKSYLEGKWSEKEIAWRAARCPKPLTTIVAVIKDNTDASFDETSVRSHVCMKPLVFQDGTVPHWRPGVVAIPLDPTAETAWDALTKMAYETLLKDFDDSIPTVPTMRRLYLRNPLRIHVFQPSAASLLYNRWSEATNKALHEVLAKIPDALKADISLVPSLAESNTVLLLCDNCVTEADLLAVNTAAENHDSFLDAIVQDNLKENAASLETFNWAAKNMHLPTARTALFVERSREDLPTKYRRFRVIPFFIGNPCKEDNIASAKYDKSPDKTRGLSRVFVAPVAPSADSTIALGT